MADESQSRRTVLKAAGGVVIGSVVGVLGIRMATDPTVVEREVDGELLGPTTFRLVVENRGGPGGVRAGVDLRDGETVLKRADTKITMNRGERRELEIEAEVPEGAETYVATATATEFPDSLLP